MRELPQKVVRADDWNECMCNLLIEISEKLDKLIPVQEEVNEEVKEEVKPVPKKRTNKKKVEK